MTTRELTRNGPDEAVAFFRKRFRAEGSPTRAAQEKRYMKSDLSFHGVDMAALRRATSTFLRNYAAARGAIDDDALVAIVGALFDTEWFDLRSAGIELLERRVSVLGPNDVPWLISLVRKSPGWAHVDWLAAKVIGPVLQDTPRMPARLRAWAKDLYFGVKVQRRVLLLFGRPTRVWVQQVFNGLEYDILWLGTFVIA
jgi:3-methyladenine DNA glycosylase AlkD